MRHWSIPFPLDLKAQHGFWDQRSETHPVEGVAVGRVLRGWGGARNSLFTQFNFTSKTRQASHWNLAVGPSVPPILKIGELFLHTPRERRGCHTGAEGPRGCWESLFLSGNIQPQKSIEPEHWAKSLVFYNSQRSFSQSNPRKGDKSELECEYNVSGPII